MEIENLDVKELLELRKQINKKIQYFQNERYESGLVEVRADSYKYVWEDKPMALYISTIDVAQTGAAVVKKPRYFKVLKADTVPLLVPKIKSLINDLTNLLDMIDRGTGEENC